MATNETGAARAESKQFLVQCDSCSFERAANGREQATAVGADHRRETGHDLIAVELPPSVDSA